MLPSAPDPLDQVFVFDGFRLDASRRSLVRGEETVPLGSRALELLIALIEQPGEILSRDHLTTRVWPRTIVEESSLRVHMAALRRALGDGQDGRRYIATIPGRGYGFVANVTQQQRGAEMPEKPVEAPPVVAVQRQPHLLGRERALSALTRLLQQHRLVTIVGPGGVGKTSLALHWAEAHASSATRVVDLACASSEAELAKLLRESAAGLLIVDSCEHLIDVAAHRIEALLTEQPQLRVLATSREPLRLEGEHVCRLGALALPQGEPTQLDEALESAAVQLLVERARASGNDVNFSDADAAALCELARQLDGLPLALELGAARVRALGLKGMLRRITELNTLLSRGRRTALPRHRSLDASIAWSYELLDDAERAVLRALSVFPGSFALNSAARVAAPAEARCGVVEEQVLRLVEKSLVLAVPQQRPAASGVDCKRYQLAHTTRRYAALQLQSRGNETRPVYARHAQDLLQRLQLAPSESVDAGLDELQQALRWCFSGADEALGVRLLHAGLTLIRQHARTDDFQAYIDKALALGAGPGLVTPMLLTPAAAAEVL